MTRLCEEAAKIRIGNGLDEGILLGPLVSKGQYDKVIDCDRRAPASTARRLPLAAARPAGFNSGYFVEPTVLTGMSEDSYVWREEIFGPVVCVKPFKDEDEAVAHGQRQPVRACGRRHVGGR